MENHLELFAIVELFGHTKMAGKVTEQNIGVATFIRVDVPATKTQPSFTRLLNPSAVYAINPVTEEVVQYTAEQITSKPIQAWDLQEMQKRLQVQLPQINSDHSDNEDDPSDW